MNALRITVVTLLTIACVPAMASAQSSSADSLIRRIEFLELQMVSFERRLMELEALSTSEQSPAQAVQTTSKWKNLQNWRQLREGMTFGDVRAVLGEPEQVDGGSLTIWRWGGARVIFISGRVTSWSEPTTTSSGY